MSKVPLNPRAPWDTHHQPSRAPSTPTRPTVTEDPCHSLTSRGVKLLLVFSQPSTTSAPRLPCPGWTLVPSLHHSNSSHPSFQTALTFDLSPDSLQRHCNTKADEHRNQTKSNEKTNSASSARWNTFKSTGEKKRCKIDVKASHTQTQNRGTYKHNVPHQEESQLCSSILYSTFFYLSFFLLLVC